MTDAEMKALFARHVRPADLVARGDQALYHEFVGSAFYNFARDLEHRAIATGMMVRLDDPASSAPVEAEDKAKASWREKAWLLIAWAVGKWPG